MRKKFSFGSLVALVLCLLFSAIVLVAVFGLLGAQFYHTFPAVIVFAIVNLLILTLLFTLKNQLIHWIGQPCYAPVALVTVVYTIAQFLHLALAYRSSSVLLYVLINLILLLVYLALVLPITAVGRRNDDRNQNRKV